MRFFGRRAEPELAQLERLVAREVARVAQSAPAPLRVVGGKYRVRCRVRERKGTLRVVEDAGAPELEHELEFRLPRVGER